MYFICFIAGIHFQGFSSFLWESLLHASLKYSLRMLPSLHLLSRVRVGFTQLGFAENEGCILLLYLLKLRYCEKATKSENKF